jgi:hypothetical protein
VGIQAWRHPPRFAVIDDGTQLCANDRSACFLVRNRPVRPHKARRRPVRSRSTRAPRARATTPVPDAISQDGNRQLHFRDDPESSPAVSSCGRSRCRSAGIATARIEGGRVRVAPRQPGVSQTRRLTVDFRHRCDGPRTRLDVAQRQRGPLRLLKVLEECRQMSTAEADAWRRRSTGWARFNAVGTEAAPEMGGSVSARFERSVPTGRRYDPRRVCCRSRRGRDLDDLAHHAAP